MRSRKLLGALVAVFVVVGLVAAPAAAAPPATGTPPSSDPFLAINFGASWLARQIDSTGSLPAGGNASVVFSNTAQAAYALASAETEEAAFDAAVSWLTANTVDNVPTDGSASPALIGYLLLVSEASGEDPTDFGGVDLIAALEGTLQADGRYGSAAATYDGVFRQALALIGLETVGETVPTDAVDWLVDQQCVAPADAAGGWEAYRADTSVPCASPDLSTFAGPDTNSTAMGTWALAAVGTAPSAPPLAFLESVQDDSGGFAYLASATASSGVDPNSTAIVIRALLAVGDRPDEAPWVRPGGDPYTALLSFQLSCESPQGDIGAFESSFTPGVADLSATIQAVWGATAGPLYGVFYPRITFTDVCEGSPFQLEIANIASCDIVRGYPDGSFHPMEATTRQAMAAFLYRFNFFPDYTPPAVPTFPDVPVDHAFYKEIEWAHSVHIVNGYDDGTFRPVTPASREATAAFLYRIEDRDFIPPETPTFTDVGPEHTFYAAIEWLAEMGITTGYPDHTFRPMESVTRQATAALFSRSPGLVLPAR